MLQQPNSPPPAFRDGEMLGRPKSSPVALPPGPMRPSHRQQSRWLWLAPLLLLTAGIGGTLVFGVLTFTKARDDLAQAKSALVEEQKERQEAESMLDGAKQTAGAAVDEVERLKKDLLEAQNVAKKQVDSTNKKVSALDKKAAALDKKAAALEKKLRSSLKKSEGEVQTDGNRLTLNLVDKVLFRSGKAELTTRGKKVIKRLGAVLKKAKDKQIFVQGHTDSVPIPKSNKNFNSNWELSAARAISVVEYLEREVKISGKRLGAVAFSKYRPIDRKRKSKNRRIEIVLLPKSIKFVGDE